MKILATYMPYHLMNPNMYTDMKSISKGKRPRGIRR
jgi:hypothetical protein